MASKKRVCINPSFPIVTALCFEECCWFYPENYYVVIDRIDIGNLLAFINISYNRDFVIDCTINLQCQRLFRLKEKI